MQGLVRHSLESCGSLIHLSNYSNQSKPVVGVITYYTSDRSLQDSRQVHISTLNKVNLQQSGSLRVLWRPMSSIVMVSALGWSTHRGSSPRMRTVNTSFGRSSHSWSLRIVIETQRRCCPGPNMRISLIGTKSNPPAKGRKNILTMQI